MLGEVRRAKALAKMSLKTEVERVIVADTEDRLKVLVGVERDVREAGKVAQIVTTRADQPSVEVVLPEPA